MNQYLEESLADLSREPLDWSDGYDGANRNIWMISIGTDEDVPVDELVAFAHRARDIRRGQLTEADGSPVTFYMWTDVLAGQLRCSVCRRVPADLPFGCIVDLTATPEPVVKDYLASQFRDGIPLSELKECGPDDEEEDSEEEYRLLVWADVIA